MTAPTRRIFSRRAFFGLPSAPGRARARVEATCLAFNGVMCESCTEVCDSGAIGFVRIGAIRQPFVDAERCTACEACIPVCPVNALSIEHPAKRGQEEHA